MDQSFPQISSPKDFPTFSQAVVDYMQDAFTQIAPGVNCSWLIPEGDKLVAFRTNGISKLPSYSWRAGEGVVGTAWQEGTLQLYSPQQVNPHFVDNSQCGDIAYMCIPLIKSANNKYGILAVGCDRDIYWQREHEAKLRAIANLVVSRLGKLQVQQVQQVTLR